MHAFPEIPIFQGINAPVRAEIDIIDLEVEGTIPAELDGAFYRVGPDWRFPPMLGTDILFNGDGAVTMLRVKDGRVDLKHRYVRTEKFMVEEAARRSLFGVYRNPFTDDPSVNGKSRNTANTNVVLHAGRLLALKEDSPPVELDPFTLETLGDWTFEGGMTSPTFTAHPKIDPVSGQMVAFGSESKGLLTPDVAYFEISPTGRVTHEVWFQTPYQCMIHDFGVTENYVIFPVTPNVGTGEETMKKGGPHWGWDETKPTYVGVMPRRGEARDIRWFKGPTQCVAHVMNAYEEDSKLHIDVPAVETTLFPWFPSIHGTPFNPEKSRPCLTRWTFDLSSSYAGFEARRLTDFIGEFPRMDDRFASRPYRHGWLLGFGGSRNELAHVDLKTGKTRIFKAPGQISVQEPQFIPRFRGADEGDGYILQFATDPQTMKSLVYFFDALAVDKGPIATLKLPMRLRPAFHGNWYSAPELERVSEQV